MTKSTTIDQKQPSALKFLFLTELWERYGLYITQGLLILYMTQHLAFTDAHAYAVLGAFSAFVYMSPLLGGYLANNVLGYRRAVMFGAILLSMGYLTLGISVTALYMGLSLVILGNGLLKPNISSFLGDFYEPHDVRREAGFTLFYVGINIGSTLGLMSGGVIAQKWGWHVSFLFAGTGLLIALGTFVAGWAKYQGHGLPVAIEPSASRLRKYLLSPIALLIYLVVLAAIFTSILGSPRASHTILNVFGVLVLIFLIFRSSQLKPRWRYRMLGLMSLIAASIVFWALWYQMIFSMSLLTERLVDRRMFGHTFPAPFYASIEGLYILSLGPFVAKMWQRLAKTRFNLSVPTKFAGGVLMIACAMLFMFLSLKLTPVGELMSPAILLVFYFFFFVGEMMVSPIGLSVVTELAHPKMVGMMMGVWFLGMGYGSDFAGIIAKQASIPKNMTNLVQIGQIYMKAFLEYAVAGIIVAGILFLLVPPLKKLMKGKAVG